MEQLSKKLYSKPERPIKIMQFGEGNFLRAFVEWIIQDLNDKGAINAGVAVVQPMPFGRVKDLADQDGLSLFDGKQYQKQQFGLHLERLLLLH